MKQLTTPRDTLAANEYAAPPLKILLSAYACEPGRGSEQGVGWNNVKEISRHHEVWVLAAAEQRQAIEDELKVSPLQNVHWVFVEIPTALYAVWKKGERGRRLHYILWQYWAYRAAKRLNKRLQFDVIHHVTYASYWTPSYLSKLRVPFVWGPVGGGDSTPLPYYLGLSWKSRIREACREMVRCCCEAFDPYVRNTARNAAVGLATTEATATKMRKLGTSTIRILSECALSIETIGDLQRNPPRYGALPFRVVSVGRLLGLKGYHLGIEAFVRMHEVIPDSEYWIVGAGTELENLKALARRHRATNYIKFTGWLSREDALSHIAAANVLLHPSLHETGSWVCLEAMAAGIPVVCLRLGGPAMIVTDETGFRVSGDNPRESIHEMSVALSTLAQNPELCREMGAAARRRIQNHFSWRQKGVAFDDIYQALVLSSRPNSRNIFGAN